MTCVWPAPAGTLYRPIRPRFLGPGFKPDQRPAFRQLCYATKPHFSKAHKVLHSTLLPKPNGVLIKCNSIRRKKAFICVNKHFIIARNNEGTINKFQAIRFLPFSHKVSNLTCSHFPSRTPHFAKTKAQNLKSF